MTTSAFNAIVRAKESALSAVVTRADGTIEDRGVIAYWHRNPLRRWWWYLRNPSKWKNRVLVGPKASKALQEKGYHP